MTRLILVSAIIVLATGAVAQAPPTAAGIGFDQFAARARARMLALDTDHDGKISKAEFAARAEQPTSKQAGKARNPSRMFDRLDTNKDGTLDAAEVNAQFARRFARMDADHNGVVTPTERSARSGSIAAEQ